MKNEEMSAIDAGLQINDASYALGELVAREGIASKLRNKAGGLFARNRDAEARLYRAMAEELEEESKAMREEYEQVKRPLRNTALTMLEKLSEAE